MTRADLLRQFWESKIPATEEEMGITDAARFINRGLKKPFQSRRTLQRRAETGRLLALGGTGTGLGPYRIRRSDLIDYLCSLDRISAPVASEMIGFDAAAAAAPVASPAPSIVPQSASGVRRTRRRDPDPDQVTLPLPGMLR